MSGRMYDDMPALAYVEPHTEHYEYLFNLPAGSWSVDPATRVDSIRFTELGAALPRPSDRMGVDGDSSKHEPQWFFRVRLPRFSALFSTENNKKTFYTAHK